jgi:hypothetical protein
MAEAASPDRDVISFRPLSAAFDFGPFAFFGFGGRVVRGSIAGIETRLSAFRGLRTVDFCLCEPDRRARGDGRSLWDRAVDAPASQDGPAWKGAGLGSQSGFAPLSLREVPQRAFAVAAGDEEGCGLIAYG